MSNHTSDVPEVLSEIIGVAIEYDLHLAPNQFITYLDLYSRYLLKWRDSENVTPINVASFYQFVSDQSLLDSAVLATESETGEQIVAPSALKPTGV
jgi:arginyl-tRNA--protein-N-Asp/Glu arginylyltransferase